MIKAKPDIKRFNKDPNDFLEGGEADKPVSRGRQKKSDEIDSNSIEVFKPEPTVQKLFRLRWDVACALKLGAAQESAKTGKRVTETDIIQNLLITYFKIGN